MTEADVRFYFDPVCPFAWMTSKWVRMVAAQRDYTVDWRFISLRLINTGIDYDSHFPAGYEEGHTSGLRLLRVAARTRAEHGPAAAGRFYEVVSGEIFDSPPVLPR
jgi:2-hydroxychromene-2-carboxylate isomerase